MRALWPGGKWRATYSLPTSSPSAASTAATPRFHRALISSVPDMAVPKKRKFSSTRSEVR